MSDPKRPEHFLRLNEMYALTITFMNDGEVLLCAKDEKDNVLVNVTEQIRALLLRTKDETHVEHGKELPSHIA